MNDFTVQIANIIPTMRCNLKCRLCSSLSPYYPVPYHPSLDNLCKQADRYFSIVSHTGRFIISGGEPSVRADLHEWIEYLTKYANQIGRLELNSNGTVIPNGRLLKSLSGYPGKVRVLVDDYGPDVSCNAGLIAEKFSGALPDGAVELRDYHTGNMHFGGWVDYGIYDLKNLNKKDDAETIKSGESCAGRKLNYLCVILNGYMYHCLRSVWLITHGVIPVNSEEVINLFDTMFTRDEIRSRITSLYSRRACASCQYCNGLHDSVPRYKPAEQLTSIEQHKIWEGLYAK